MNTATGKELELGDTDMPDRVQNISRFQAWFTKAVVSERPKAAVDH